MRRIVTAQTDGEASAGTKVWGLASPAVLLGKVGAGEKLEEVVLSAKLRERDGFIYLEIPDEIVDAFMKQIPRRGIEKPEAASDKEYVGAHVSVMYEDEYKSLLKKRNGRRISELGQSFDYTLDKLYSTQPDGWDEVKEVFFLSIKSPALEALRKKYGLSKLLNGHDFHITVAVKRK